MIVVADASPLNYLIHVSCDTLLRDLYGRVFVPTAVLSELRHPLAPPRVGSWAAHPPSWIEVRVVNTQADLTLEALDQGEREAIQLAQEERAGLLLIDEKRGRLEAKRRGIPTTGTLGILVTAGVRGLIEAEVVFNQLVTSTTFRTTPEVRDIFLKLVRERKGLL
jgi:predicted nucleic acid-binding protein